MSKSVASTLALVNAAVVLLAGVSVWWWTSDLRVIGPVIIGLGVIASGMVAYFEWRANLRRRMIGEAEDHARRVRR